MAVITPSEDEYKFKQKLMKELNGVIESTIQEAYSDSWGLRVQIGFVDDSKELQKAVRTICDKLWMYKCFIPDYDPYKKSKGKKRLIFAPAKYLDLNDTDLLTKHGLKDIEYCQLPFEIYKLRD